MQPQPQDIIGWLRDVLSRAPKVVQLLVVILLLLGSAGGLREVVVIGYDLITTSEQEKATSRKTYRDDCTVGISILKARYERSQGNERSQRLQEMESKEKECINGLNGLGAIEKLKQIAPQRSLKTREAVPEDQLQEIIEVLTVAKLAPALLLESEDHLALGNAYYLSGNYQSAVSAFGASLNQSKTSKGLNNRALSWYALGLWDEAVSDFNAAAEVEPDSPVVLNNRGAVWEAIARYDLALQDLDAAINLRPDDPVILTNRASVWNKIGEPARALEDLETALQLRPSFVDALSERGVAFTKLGDAEGFTDLELALELEPNNPWVQYGLARAWATKGDASMAVDWLQGAIALQPIYGSLAQSDADFAAVRQDQAFQQVLKDYLTPE